MITVLRRIKEPLSYLLLVVVGFLIALMLPLGYLFLGETFGREVWMGVAVLMVGGLLANVTGFRHGSPAPLAGCPA
ncbi:hypothetical protein [Marinobacter sp. SS21]|uniref:hypothetical protein n=1 Tax=Marinobacter sp. SS21 TaxID=2979460 RepID=UPI00232FBCD3|nr:hypothetical protein [Marinobacter sp. SS21]MDC0661286.1 hypothetical protein [Marinobacter sp. SS21]